MTPSRRTELDVQLHDLMLAEGEAHFGAYTAPAGGDSVPVRTYIERGVLVRGDFGQLVGRRDELQILNPGFELKPRGEIYIPTPGGAGGERFVLGELLADDGSVSPRVGRRV